MDPLVTVLVPAYRAAGLLPGQLAWLAGQPFADFRVVVSVDGGDEETAGAARAAVPDDRFAVVLQEGRLGWAGNVNALLAHVRTPWFVVLAQDDAWEGDYLGSMVRALRGSPWASYAVPGVRARGTVVADVVPVDLRGDLPARLHRWLDSGVFARYLPWRALTPAQFVEDGLRVRVAGHQMWTDMLWALDVVTRGQGVAVPGVAYAKHTHDGGVVARWERAGWPAKVEMAAEHLGLVAARLAETRLRREDRQRFLARYAAWVIAAPEVWNGVRAGRDPAGVALADAEPALAALIATALRVATEPGAPW